MHLDPRRLLPVVTAAAVLVGAAACTPADAPVPAGPVTYEVPDAPVSVTAPAGWQQSTQDGAFLVRSAEAYGTPPVRPNVVVTAGTTTRTLEQAGADTVAYVEELTGWAHDADGQGPTTLGDAPAYRVSGTFEAGGALVAQEIVLVTATGPAGPGVVHLTASWAPDDVEGGEQARAVLESVRVDPAGVDPAG